MRRLILVLAGAAVLAGGLLAAYAVHRLRQERNVRGSSTLEFTLTTSVERPPGPPAKVQWPTYGFDPQRTHAVELALRPPFRTPIWRYQASSLIEFPPAVGYGRLFFATNSGNLTAIAAKDGQRAWIFRTHRCVAASPTLGPHAHGTVYEVFLNHPPCNAQTGGRGVDGLVMAISAGNHRVHWRHVIGPSETSPLLVGDRLYVGDWNGNVWAFDANHGRVLWRQHVGGAVKGALAYADGRLFLGAYDGHVYCLDASDGRQVWRASAQPRLFGTARFYSTPAVAYGRVYIGSTDGKLYSFGATTGALRWAHDTGGYVYASPAVWHGLVLAGSYSRRFEAFDAATGDVRWSFPAGGQISGSATVIGNVVYFATLHDRTRLKGRTYALAAATGKLLWTFPDGKYTPVVAVPGHLFLIGYGLVYGMVPR
ncbi:MAG: outer membrane protein assembly factor BamB family protein [Gaiellaceae bacterium]